MISKSNEFTRRILNFPAIRPCESVSFSTLLTSLINLCHSICSVKSMPIYTNKKNTKSSIHLIETLLVFLEEIRHGSSRTEPEASMVLCLSELHFIFQKIHFLLEDCARDDARLWMLMKSEKVSTHFRVLIRSVTVALDVVLPLTRRDVADEAEEVVELVRKQALKAKFDVERDDRRSMRRVLRVVNGFESGIAPDSRDLKRVLDYLRIETWNECNNEIRALEIESGQECGAADKRDVQLLSSLTAFMIYCRCTLFDDVRNNVSQHQSGNDDRATMTCLNPNDFRCPITLEIMTDPVTITTGHTYDRSSILRWFRSGNHTCPKTGERLICVDLVPNQLLKQLIRKYCGENGIPFPESGGLVAKPSSQSVTSLAAEEATKLLAAFLVRKLIFGTNEEQSKAAYEIRLLTKTSNFNRSCLVQGGAIPPLLNLLSSINSSQENSMAAVLNLSKHSESKRIIMENRGAEIIVDVLNGSGLTMEARQHAAGTLFYLASVEEYRKTIGRIPGSIYGLMDLLEVGTTRGKKNALMTILGLLMYPENHWRFLSGGLVFLLINLLKSSSEREDILTDSLAVLAALGEKLDGATAIISAGALPVVLEILSSSNSRSAREYSVSLLLALCVNDGADVVPILVKNPSLMVSLYSVLADGSSRSSKKAGSLIRILQAFNEKGYPGSMVSGLPQDRFVHAW